MAFFFQYLLVKALAFNHPHKARPCNLLRLICRVWGPCKSSRGSFEPRKLELSESGETTRVKDWGFTIRKTDLDLDQQKLGHKQLDP